MRNFSIALCVVVVLTYFYDKGHLGSKSDASLAATNTISLSLAAKQCQKELPIQDCSIKKIQDLIREKSTNPSNSANAFWSTSNELVDFSSGALIKLTTNELHLNQKLVWDSFLNESKNNPTVSEKKMSDNNILGIVFFIFLFAIGVWLIFALLPLIWKFFLNRVAEVSKAAKGEKID